jgi:hypothetical protein
MTNSNALDRIMHLHDQVLPLDLGTLSKILPSWGFIANNQAINAALRFVPDHSGEAEGIEGYSSYELARRTSVREAEHSVLPALISLQRTVWGWMIDAGVGRNITTDSTIEYLNATLKYNTKAPTAERYKEDWRLRKAQMPDFAIPMDAFVQYEMDRAMNQYNQLLAKGDDAIRLIDTLSLDVQSDEIPDWLPDAFEQKMLDKLHDRWSTLEIERTNLRSDKRRRDVAKANQLMVVSLLAEYGETAGY